MSILLGPATKSIQLQTIEPYSHSLRHNQQHVSLLAALLALVVSSVQLVAQLPTNAFMVSLASPNNTLNYYIMTGCNVVILLYNVLLISLLSIYPQRKAPLAHSALSIILAYTLIVQTLLMLEPLIVGHITESFFWPRLYQNAFTALIGASIGFLILPFHIAQRWVWGLYANIAMPLLFFIVRYMSDKTLLPLLITYIQLLGLLALCLLLAYGLALLRKEVTKAHSQADFLEQIAYQDSLTGLNNRRKLYDVLPREIARTQRYTSPLSVVLWDIDGFKGVNDTYGHIIGDSTLKAVAQLAKNHTRQSDYLGRWGGEEFLFVLPGTTLADAERFAERLREHLAKTHMPPVGQITASFGVAQYRAQESMTHLMRRADRALYQAKNSGRNCVVTTDDQHSTALMPEYPSYPPSTSSEQYTYSEELQS